MNDHPGPRDVNALVAWLRDFYCKTYLGDCPKARAIVHFLDSNPPAAGISVTEYLKQFQHGRNETLAQLIGGNRLSHLNRSPWGLKQVIQLFQYEKCSMDTTATQNTKIMFKP